MVKFYSTQVVYLVHAFDHLLLLPPRTVEPIVHFVAGVVHSFSTKDQSEGQSEGFGQDLGEGEGEGEGKSKDEDSYSMFMIKLEEKAYTWPNCKGGFCLDPQFRTGITNLALDEDEVRFERGVVRLRAFVVYTGDPHRTHLAPGTYLGARWYRCHGSSRCTREVEGGLQNAGRPRRLLVAEAPS